MVPRTMTSTVDRTELSLGIRCYLSSGQGFLAASKARYSDFLVHEVNLSGEVAHLTDLSGKISNRNVTQPDHEIKEERTGLTSPSATASAAAVVGTAAIDVRPTDSVSGAKRKHEDVADQRKDGDGTSEKALESETIGDLDRTKLLDLLQRTSTLCFSDEQEKPGYNDEQLHRILQFALSHNGNSEQKCMQIPLLASATKDDRKKWHEMFRVPPLSKYVVTDTDKQNSSSGDVYVIRLWHKDFEKEMPNFGKFDRSNIKKGKGDNDVRAPKNLPHLQFVLYKENMETGAALQQLQRRGGRGRSIRLRIGHAGMKDKRGVTCQFVTVPSSTSISLLTELNKPRPAQHGQQEGGGHTQTRGAGLLRVGNFCYVKEEMRLGRLRGNRFTVVLRHIRQDDQSASDCSDFKANCKALVQNAVGDLKKFGFINYFGMQRFGKYQDTHLVGIAVLQGNFEKAVDIIMRPKATRDERASVHNARLAWQKRFDSIEGAIDIKAKAEKAVAQKFLDEHGRFLSSEQAICQSLVRSPLDYQQAFSNINKTMRMMFLHAVQSLIWNNLASYKVEKMMQQEGHVSVVPGDLVVLSDQNLAESSLDATEGQLPEVHVVTADDVASGKYKLEDVVLPLIGKNTAIPSYCQQVLDDLLSEHSLTMISFEEFAEKKFSCPGQYRKLVCRPQDVDFELLEYSDPLEPLCQTDLMKLSNIPILCRSATDSSEAALLGMRIGFTLPPSGYATIALRELMKKPTSSQFQSGLKLDVPGERDADRREDTIAPKATT